jgi:hypothetical protein
LNTLFFGKIVLKVSQDYLLFEMESLGTVEKLMIMISPICALNRVYSRRM